MTMRLEADATILSPAPDPVVAAHDAFAPHYDAAYRSRRCCIEDRLLAARLRCFLGIDPGPVLDVGCGTGAALRLTGLPVARYTGVDISPGMLACARSAFPSARFTEATVEALPFRAARFDAVISTFGALSFVTSPLRALDEIHRVLRPGGRCWLMVMAPRWYRHNPPCCGVLSLETAPAAWSCWQAIHRCTLTGFHAVHLSAFSMLPTPLLRWETPLTGWLPGRGRYLVITAEKSS